MIKLVTESTFQGQAVTVTGFYNKEQNQYELIVKYMPDPDAPPPSPRFNADLVAAFQSPSWRRLSLLLSSLDILVDKEFFDKLPVT
jgi:hypothetical protein